MKAFLCSIGEPTTELTAKLLTDYGFDVQIIATKESWHEKYLRFLRMAIDECIRIDADIIPNENIKFFVDRARMYQKFMAQCVGWDFYKNNIGIVSPVYYSKECLQVLRDNIDKIKKDRPETSAWRLLDKEKTMTMADLPCGIHGVYQRHEDITRHEQHKIERKQIKGYNFYIAKQCATIGNH